MNAKRNKTYAALTLLTSLAVGAVPAGAVSFVGFYNLEQHGGGTSFRVLPSFKDHFCYLSRVGVAETDINSEWVMCDVRESGGVWILEAKAGRRGKGDHDVWCTALCYTRK